jgi:hypothetical protein
MSVEHDSLPGPSADTWRLAAALHDRVDLAWGEAVAIYDDGRGRGLPNVVCDAMNDFELAGERLVELLAMFRDAIAPRAPQPTDSAEV